ncbi:hypothetical protein [Microbacterium sp. ZXX196]|uniref:hypothetical protein n=1 Tax=Microbacterium sp. ZXX196 TaxID=2609291 RepID=UPI0012B9399F|nr:hypothetical protein [Microbacterium sp. ZXX196]MTE22774.1 hypothetical protein [Microbacterium sp. ZXX196]
MVFWGKRKRVEQEKQDAADADLAVRAQQALVAADERIRTTRDELEFASAELGDAATKDLRDGLDAVATHMREAFELHQLNHDHIPDTPEELRTRNARIAQLCDWAEDVLDERTEVLRERIEKVREAPQTLERVRAEAAALAERLPGAEETIARLGARYSPAAIQRIGANPAEARQLLEFARHSAEVAGRRRADGRRDDAMVALETATEAVRRARTILDAVDDFEIEAMRTQTTLSDVVADSRSDLLEARAESGSARVRQAIAELEQALAAVTPAGTPSDPFAELAALSEKNAALDAARERAQRNIPSIDHVRHDVDAADRAISHARSLIDGHRGWVGADARTRLAEAERVRIDAGTLVADEDTRERAQSLARRAAQLAHEAMQLAQRDIDSSRHGGYDDGMRGYRGGFGGRGGMGGMGGGDMIGGLIGGALLGGLIGDIFD